MGQNEEIFKHIELFVGSIGVILSLFFGVFLLLARKQQLKANTFLAIYLLAFSLRIGKSLFFNYFSIDPVIRNVFLGVLLAIGPSLWYYSYVLKGGENTLLKKGYLWHYLPMVLFMAFCWFIPNDGSAVAGVFYYCLIVHMLGYTVYTLFWLSRNKAIDTSSKERRIHKWLRFFTYTTLVILVFIALISTRIIPYYLGMAFLFSVVVICFAVYALKNPFLFRASQEKYSNSGLTNEQALPIMAQLDVKMKAHKLFLDPELSLAKLSKKMGITTKQLSQVINQSKKMNYSQYVTEFRVAEAKRLLRSSEHSNLKISAIVYDSGFNSLSSFNMAFKKNEGVTAAAYRQSFQQ